MLLLPLMPVLFVTSFNSFNNRFSIFILQRKKSFLYHCFTEHRALWFLLKVATFDNSRFSNSELVKIYIIIIIMMMIMIIKQIVTIRE